MINRNRITEQELQHLETVYNGTPAEYMPRMIQEVRYLRDLLRDIGEAKIMDDVFLSEELDEEIAAIKADDELRNKQEPNV